jgi:hypothetical protein
MHWPCCVWSVADVCPADIAPVLMTCQPDKLLVRFYGALDFAWLRPAVLTPYDLAASPTKLKLKRMPTMDSKRSLGATTRRQLLERSESADAEIERLSSLAKDGVRCNSSYCQQRYRTTQCGHQHRPPGGATAQVRARYPAHACTIICTPAVGCRHAGTVSEAGLATAVRSLPQAWRSSAVHCLPPLLPLLVPGYSRPVPGRPAGFVSNLGMPRVSPLERCSRCFCRGRA